MGEAQPIRFDASLRQVLADPASSSALRRPRLSPGLLRLGTALSDAAQVILVGMVLRLLPLAAVEAPGPKRVFGMGVLAACLAYLIRRGVRPSIGLRPCSAGEEAQRAALAVLMAFAIIILAQALLGQRAALQQQMPWMVAWCAASTAIAAALRFVSCAVAQRAGGAATAIAVVGPEAQARPLARLLRAHPGGTWRVVTELRDDRAEDLAQLDRLVGQERVNLVLLAGVGAERASLICGRLADARARVCVGFDAAALEAAWPEPDQLGRLSDLPLVDLLPDPLDWRGAVKRAMDIALVLAVLPVIAPVLIAAAIAIKLESPGPVLFRQWRFGLCSRPTQVLKFRTMYVDRGDATGEQRTLARDPRVTRVGRILRRTSIDELPQLLNVLRGDMSLVGPRPHATHMKVEGCYYFEAVEHYRLRHRVKPGITGWAQINGSRGEVDTLEKAQRRLTLDLWYIRNWSLALDLWIVLRTALGGFASPRAD